MYIEQEIEKSIKEYYDNFTDEVQHVYDKKPVRVIDEVTFTVEGMAEFIKRELERIADLVKKECDEENKITENTSDGYHTFKELYEFRKLYNAGFFNELFKNHYAVHKSKRHNDGGVCFDGNWFIVMAYLADENGEPLQISNHYELKDWDLFKCEEKEIADEWDGHTTQDVINRLNTFLKAK